MKLDELRQKVAKEPMTFTVARGNEGTTRTLCREHTSIAFNVDKYEAALMAHAANQLPHVLKALKGVFNTLVQQEMETIYPECRKLTALFDLKVMLHDIEQADNVTLLDSYK